jgi:hypothetical protein
MIFPRGDKPRGAAKREVARRLWKLLRMGKTRLEFQRPIAAASVTALPGAFPILLVAAASVFQWRSTTHHGYRRSVRKRIDG